MNPQQLPLLRHPSSPHHEPHRGDDFEPKGQAVPIVIDVKPELSIEDGIRFGMREVLTRQSGIVLRLKGIDLTVQQHDSFELIFARYKEQEFNAFAESYERDFVGRNAAMYSVAAATLRDQASRYPDPMRMLDIGCGTGFALREAFAGRAGGKYFGIDPAENMLQVLNRTAKGLPLVEVSTRQSKAGVIRVDSVRQDILATLGGRPQVIAWLAVMHVVNKHEHLGPLLSETADLLDPSGCVVIGNYFHRSLADFEAFRERYMRAMIHQPTPPNQLFTPEQMEAMLRSNWLTVESCEEMICTDGLRAYVMVAKHK